MTLALGMIVRNEAPMLRLTLPVHAKEFQVKIALDTGSTDDTIAILREHGFTVMHVQWRDDFSYARNIVLDVAETLKIDWMLMLDADETMWPDDIKGHLLMPSNAVIRLPRMNLARHGEIQEYGSYPDLQARCIRPSSKVRYKLPVHEVIAENGVECFAHIWHYGWCKTVRENALRSRNYERILNGNPTEDELLGHVPDYDDWLEEM